jgi:hypothetical protein
MNLNRIAGLLPRPISEWLVGGRIHRAYSRAEEIRRGVEPATFSTPAGSFTIAVFDTWRLLGQINAGGRYEPVLMEELCNRLSEDSVYYDVGSRWGAFTSLAKVADVPPPQIHGFEASLDAFGLLASNHSGEGIYLTHGFVGDHDVDIRLEEYAEPHDPPSVMKIDIEGAELRALKGASRILESEDVTLFVEVHPQHIREFGGHQDELFGLLADAGFSLSVCLENREVGYEWHWADDVKLPSEGDYLLLAEKN